MRTDITRSLLVAALVFALAEALPSGASFGTACTPLLAGTPGGAVSPAGLVAGTLTWVGPTAACTGGATDVFSLAASCPTGFIGALPGVFCGPLVAPGGSTSCVWKPFVGGPTGILVGYDLPTTAIGYDGNLGIVPGAGESTIYASTTANSPTLFTNPSAVFVGKLLAFPYNAGIGPSVEDVTLVTCGP